MMRKIILEIMMIMILEFIMMMLDIIMMIILEFIMMMISEKL